jgi:hypothetical protein
MGFLPTYQADSISVLIGTVGGGVMTAGSAALGPVGFTPLPGHSTAQYFSPSDVGCIVEVLGAGASGGNLVAKIASYVDTQNVVLDTAASTSVAGDVSNTIVFRKCPAKMDTFSYGGTLTSRDTGGFTTESLDGSFVPSEGQPVLFQSSDPAYAGYTYGVFFGGTVDSVEVDNNPGTPMLSSRCECVSWETLASKRLTRSKTYNTRTALYIVQDIVTNWLTGEGVVVSGIAGPTIPSLTLDDYAYVSDGLDRVAQAVSDSTTVYFWKFDPWRTLVFQDQATTSAPWDVSDADASDGNILISLTVTRTREKYANHAYIEASKTLSDLITETYHGITAAGVASKKSFTTLNTPAIPPTAKVNGSTVQVDETTVDPNDAGTWPDSWVVNISGTAVTLVSGNPFTAAMTGKTVVTNNDLFLFTFVDGSHGTLNRTAGTLSAVAFYLAPEIPAGSDWGWITGTNRLWTDVYHAALGTSDTIAITYQTAGVKRAFYSFDAGVNERSTVEGGTGYYETVVKIDNPISPDELQALAQSVAERFGLIPTKVDFQTYRPGLGVGQEITFHTVEVAGSFTITAITLTVENGWPKWKVTGTNGSIIGDWKAALIGAFGGSVVVAGGGGAGVTIGTSGPAAVPQPLALAYPNTPGQVGVTYSMSPAVSGGTAPYGYTIVAGSLSGTGLALNATTGEISGTPTTAGFVSITVRVTDSAGTPATVDFAVSVAISSPSGNPIPPGTTGTLPRATDITALTIPYGLNNDTNFPYDQVAANGNHYFSIPSFTLSDIGCIGDPNAYYIRITAQDYDASNNPIGPEQPFAGTLVGAAGSTGNTYTFGPLEGAYGTDGFSYVRTGELAKIGIRVYVINNTDQSSYSFANTAASRLETSIGTAGLTLIDVAKIVQDTAHGGKRAPIGTFDHVDRTNIGGGVQFDPVTGKLITNNDNPTATFLDNGSFEFASPGMLGAAGTAPGWNYGLNPGGSIEIRNDGGNSGPQYARLSGADTQISQTKGVQGGQPFYLQLAVRSSNTAGTAHAVGIYIVWLDANNAPLTPYTTIVGTASLYVPSWEAVGVSGYVTAPSNAAKAIIKIALSANEPSGGYWDVDDAFMQPVISQTGNSQANTTNPSANSSDHSALRATSLIDSSNSYYGRRQAFLVAPDGVTKAQISVSNAVATLLALTTGSQAIFGNSSGPLWQLSDTANNYSVSLQMPCGNGGLFAPQLTIVLAGVVFTGYTGTVQAAYAANKPVKNGMICN